MRYFAIHRDGDGVPSGGSIVFEPWVYLTITLLCVGVAIRTRSVHPEPIVILGSTSLLLVAPLFAFGLSADYRYMWWTVLVGFLELVILFDGVGRKRGEGID